MHSKGLVAVATVLVVALAGCTDVPTANEPAGADDAGGADDAPSTPLAENESVAPSTGRPFDLGPADPVRWAVDGSMPGLPYGSSMTAGPGGNESSGPSDARSAQENGSFTDTTREGACDGPPADAAFANAVGSGTAIIVRERLLDVVNESLVHVESNQSGVGEDEAGDDLADLEVADPTGTHEFIVRATVANVTARGNVSNGSAESRQNTVAELVDVDILDGLVTADVVRANASTRATPHGASWSSDGSVLEGVRVNGEFTETSKPWFTLDVSGQFGNGSTITLFETMGHVHTPVKPIDGFAADMKINMVHVLLRDIAPGVEGDQAVNVFVSQVHSHSDFPEDPGCRPVQGVHGHAYNMHGMAELPAQPATYGYATIPRSGGAEERHLGHLEVGSNSGDAVTSSSNGSLEEGRSVTRSVSEVLDVCLLETAAGCTVSATSVRVEALAEVSSDGQKTTGADTIIQSLMVAGEDVCPTVAGDGVCRPEPNTEIPLPGGLGTLILNEQLAMPSETPECHAGIKVRGIHVEPAPINERVVVSEAEAAAFYCPNPATLP